MLYVGLQGFKALGIEVFGASGLSGGCWHGGWFTAGFSACACFKSAFLSPSPGLRLRS